MLQNKAKLSDTARQSKAELSCWQRRPHLHEKRRTTRDEVREAETRQTGRKTRDARREMHMGRTTDIKTQARTAPAERDADPARHDQPPDECTADPTRAAEEIS